MNCGFFFSACGGDGDAARPPPPPPPPGGRLTSTDMAALGKSKTDVAMSLSPKDAPLSAKKPEPRAHGTR